MLIQPIVQRMVERGEGKVLITGSIAGHMAGAFQAVYNGSKAFIDSFAAALNEEIKDSGVTVTCLKPGATETNFFHRAELDDTKVGQAKKDDPADVAKAGWEAMKKGEPSVIYGLKNKMQVAGAVDDDRRDDGQAAPRAGGARQRRQLNDGTVTGAVRFASMTEPFRKRAAKETRPSSAGADRHRRNRRRGAAPVAIADRCSCSCSARSSLQRFSALSRPRLQQHLTAARAHRGGALGYP